MYVGIPHDSDSVGLRLTFKAKEMSFRPALFTAGALQIAMFAQVPLK